MASNDQSDRIPPKPSRPFTEYHIFFQLERNHILQTPDDLSSSNVDTTVDFADADPHAATRPPRYRSLILPMQWHVKGSRPKRRSERKTHGRITFLELTKLVSRRWREADAVTRDYCRDLAQRELKRYRKEVDDYVERYGKEAIYKVKKADKTNKEAGQKETEKKAKQRTRKEEDELVQRNLNLLLENQAATPAASHSQKANETGLEAKLERLKRENMNLLLNNQAAMLAAYQGPRMCAALPVQVLPESYARSSLDTMRSDLLHLQQGQVLQQQMLQQQFRRQQQLCNYPNLLTGMMQSQAQTMAKGRSQDRRKAVENPPRSRATNQGRPQKMMPQVKVNQGRGGMVDSHQFNIRGMKTNKKTTATIAVGDQGQLPPLFEDEEYCDLPMRNKSLDAFVMDSPRRERFDDAFDTFDGNVDEVPTSSFADHSIVGPMGIRPTSPAAAGGPRITREVDGMDEDPTAPGANPGIGGNEGDDAAGDIAKSISPVPEYNIAPEISFLAKNFVNEFSRYLNHDHEVQREAEHDSARVENGRGAASDHRGMEKQALDGMLLLNSAPAHANANDGCGFQEKRSTDNTMFMATARGEDTSMSWDNMGMYCMPVKGCKSDPSKLGKNSVKNNTFIDNKGSTPPDASKPINQSFRAAPRWSNWFPQPARLPRQQIFPSYNSNPSATYD